MSRNPLRARRILAMSTGHLRTTEEANRPLVNGYPPAAQVLGQLVNAVFLDAIDEDVSRMERMNEMIGHLPAEERNGFKRVELFVLRPSRDLGKIAGESTHSRVSRDHQTPWGRGGH